MNLRPATSADAPACAEIVCEWLSCSPWMPSGPSRGELEGMMREGFPKREVWIAEGDDAEVLGYLSFAPGDERIMGLYVAQPGDGTGKALLDKAKEGRDHLTLRTHAPNGNAHRFYEREGFAITERDVEGSDGVKEHVMEWRR